MNRTGCVAVLSLVLLSGCHALEKLRGYNASAQIELSNSMIKSAKQIVEIAKAAKIARTISVEESVTSPIIAEEYPEVTTEPDQIEEDIVTQVSPVIIDPMDAIITLGESIETAAVDNRDRAILVHLDTNHIPADPVVLGSPQDNLMFAAYAGQGYKRNDRREWLSGLSKRIAQGLANFTTTVIKSFIPGWFLKLSAALAGMVLISLAVLFIVWIRGKMFKRGAIQLVDLANQYVPKDILAQTKGLPAQNVYYYARDKGLLTQRKVE